MEPAADEVAERLSQQILANWKGKVEGSRVVRLVLSEIAEFGELKAFKQTLREEVDQVEEIWDRSFEGNTAKMDVEIVSSSSGNFVDQLSSLSVHGKPVRVISFTSNVVQLAIGARKGGKK